MVTPYISLRCTQHLFSRAQYQLRLASFVSLGRTTGQDNSAELSPSGIKPEHGGTTRLQHDFEQQRYNGLRDFQKQPKGKEEDPILESLFASNQAQQPPATYRYSRKPLALFNEVTPLEKDIKLASKLEPRTVTDFDAPPLSTNVNHVSQYPKKLIEQRSDLESKQFAMVQQLSNLHENLHDESEPLEKIWQSCVKVIESKTWKQNVRSETFRGHTIFSLFYDILLEVTRRRSICIDGVTLSPVDILAIYRCSGIGKFWWHDVLWVQLGNIMELRHRGHTKELLGGNTDGFAALLQDILQVWTSFVQVYHSVGAIEQRFSLNPSEGSLIRFHVSRSGNLQAQDTVEGPRGLSHIADLEEAIPAPPKKLSQRFQALLGNTTRTTKRNYVAVAAVLTLHYIEVFRAENPLAADSLIHGEILTRLFGFIASDVDWDCPGFEACLKNVAVPAEVIDAARSEWARSPVGAVRDSPSAKDLSELARRKASSEWTEKTIERLFSDLNHVKDSSDAAQAADLWRRIRPILNPKMLKDEQIRSQVFSRFLTTLFASRQHYEAIDVWNHMLRIAHKPNLKHWNAMLHGCSITKDLPSLNGIWSSMLRAQVQPDNELWTTYIHGVIKAGKWQQGLKLLEQLGREWRSNRTSMLKPSLGPVHGALSGLLQIGRKGMLSAIIDWARSHGLSPTVYTYNILLRPLTRNGAPLEIQAHLETMVKNNCQPDIFSYTMVLEGLVLSEQSPFHNLTQDEQDSTINAFLTEMQANNINPTPHTYTTILNGLLEPKHNKSNIPAARNIMNRMQVSGIYPSPHIHVILLNHYFSLSPPDLPAIDSLLHTLLHNPSTAPKNLDHIFYDRLIYNFAKIDEYEKALKFMKRMVGEGKAPSWAALCDVLKSLERAEEWDLCAEVVEGVECGEIMRWGGERRGGAAMTHFFGKVDGLRERGLISCSTRAADVATTIHSIPSPNGALIATLQRSRLLVRCATSTGILQAWPVPQDFTSRCTYIRWSRPQHTSSTEANLSTIGTSTRVSLADAETIRIYDLADSTWQATITGASSNLGKPANIAFGSDANEILVFSDFGVKLTIWSLLTSRGVEIRDPKYMTACFDYRPTSGHFALITRRYAQDVLLLMEPGSYEVLKSVELGTIDAQEVCWSRDGCWIALRDAASAGHRVQIYTADGQLYRTFTGPEYDGQIEIGVKCLKWSPAGTLLVGDYNGTVTVLSKNIFSPVAQLRHTTPISISNVPVWEEQINASRERSYIPATQPAIPPTSTSFAKSTPPKIGISLLACNNSGTLLATRDDAAPTTTWIWSMQSCKAIAILIHHSPIKQLTWHMDQPNLLLIQCAIPEPALHIWSGTWDAPRIITMPIGKVNGKLEASWLRSSRGEAHNVILSSQTQSVTAEISSTGEVIPAVPDVDVAAGSMGTGPDDMFDEGNSLDFSPIKIEGTNGFGTTLNESGPCFWMAEEGVEDTFHYRRQVKATG